MRATTTIFCLLALLLLSACAATPPSAGAYPPAPENFRDTIKGYFSRTLKDPESARYEFIQPQRGYLAYFHTIQWKGYMVPVYVNAKNSYGGYTGAKPYMVLLNRESINKVLKAGSLDYNSLYYANGERLAD